MPSTTSTTATNTELTTVLSLLLSMLCFTEQTSSVVEYSRFWAKHWRKVSSARLNSTSISVVPSLSVSVWVCSTLQRWFLGQISDLRPSVARRMTHSLLRLLVSLWFSSITTASCHFQRVSRPSQSSALTQLMLVC